MTFLSTWMAATSVSLSLSTALRSTTFLFSPLSPSLPLTRFLSLFFLSGGDGSPLNLPLNIIIEFEEDPACSSGVCWKVWLAWLAGEDLVPRERRDAVDCFSWLIFPLMFPLECRRRCRRRRNFFNNYLVPSSPPPPPPSPLFVRGSKGWTTEGGTC